MLRCRRRYGGPIWVLNLVKLHERHPRESLLGQELAAAVSYLNRQAGAALCLAFFPCLVPRLLLGILVRWFEAGLHLVLRPTARSRLGGLAGTCGAR